MDVSIEAGVPSDQLQDAPGHQVDQLAEQFCSLKTADGAQLTQTWDPKREKHSGGESAGDVEEDEWDKLEKNTDNDMAHGDGSNHERGGFRGGRGFRSRGFRGRGFRGGGFRGRGFRGRGGNFRGRGGNSFNEGQEQDGAVEATGQNDDAEGGQRRGRWVNRRRGRRGARGGGGDRPQTGDEGEKTAEENGHEAGTGGEEQGNQRGSRGRRRRFRGRGFRGGRGGNGYDNNDNNNNIVSKDFSDGEKPEEKQFEERVQRGGGRRGGFRPRGNFNNDRDGEDGGQFHRGNRGGERRFNRGRGGGRGFRGGDRGFRGGDRGFRGGDRGFRGGRGFRGRGNRGRESGNSMDDAPPPTEQEAAELAEFGGANAGGAPAW